MSLTIRGLDRLITKLNTLDHISAREAVEEVVEDVTASMKVHIPKDTGKAREAIGRTETEQYDDKSYYVKIGLKQSIAPWDDWKGAYFNHYGFRHWKSKKMVTGQVGWFDRSVDAVAKPVRAKVRKRLQDEVRNALK